ncbi:hypothetical protein M8998_04790 [Sphingobacterium sp. lm-10]|uniref:VOC family protein n=1 Tax=Sphingobacterium sp. lm-10 TaxID=2944904 RepID=UPI0020225AB6|nr:VOC family protein [Sphingobacterium sp. lm-10]MCL7987255.1 hypothetical protein [Sphingobacterium sp. lm-10]
MKIRQLTLYTNKLPEQKDFYLHVLGFPLIEEMETSFVIEVGWSRLEFRQSEEAHLYHYCFLIPSNKLYEALAWMESKVAIIDTETNEKIVFFDDWNPHSFYFYDGAGNIAECIVRHDLKNTSDLSFNISDFLCVNEIGLPTKDISQTLEELETNFGISLWKGDLLRFAASGSQYGLFLLPNYRVKETWFPTDITIACAPFTTVIEKGNNKYSFDYIDGKISNIKTITS